MSLIRRLRSLFRRSSTEAEMAEEMRYHLEQRAAEYAADGLAAEEARLAAQRRFGNTASIQERAREAWGWGAVERLGNLVFWRIAIKPGRPVAMGIIGRASNRERGHQVPTSAAARDEDPLRHGRES